MKAYFNPMLVCKFTEKLYKRKLEFLYVFIFIFMQLFCVNLFAQESKAWYAQKWSDVKTEQNTSIKKAIDIVEEIEKRSEKDKDYVNLFRAWKTRVDLQGNLNWESRALHVDSLLTLAERFKSKEAAMAYNLTMAELLTRRYNWEIGYIRDDYKTMSVSMWNISELESAVTEHVKRALTNRTDLKSSSIGDYAIIFSDNEEKNIPSPDLYFLVIRKAISILHRHAQSEYLEALCREFINVSYSNAVMDIYSHTRQHEIKRESWAYKMEKLDSLISLYKDDSNVVLAYSKKIGLQIQENYENKTDDCYQKLSDRCDSIMLLYPNSSLLHLLKNYKDDFARQGGGLIVQNQIYPNTETEFEIVHRNIKELTLEVYRVHDSIERHIGNVLPWVNTDCIDSKKITIDKDAEVVWAKKIKLNGPLNVYKTTPCTIKIKEVGDYALVCKNEEGREISKSLFSVSSVGFVLKTTAKTPQVYAADFMTGKPLPEVELIAWRNNSNMRLSEDVRINGLTDFFRGHEHNDSWYKVGIKHGEDIYAKPIVTKFYHPILSTNKDELAIYTDRRRYQPGDTIFFTAVLHSKGSNSQLKEGVEHTFILQAPSYYKTQISQTLTSNEWGAYNAYLVLPRKGLMGGDYRIVTQKEISIYGNNVVNIDEYKQPEFSIDINTKSNAYVSGDSIVILGKINSYSGHIINKLEVSYHIALDSYRESRILIDEGKAYCNDAGEFVFSFKSKRFNKLSFYMFDYTITVSAKDASGNTQKEIQTIRIYDAPYLARIEMPDLLCKEIGGDVLIDVTNLNDFQLVEGVKGRYKIQNSDSVVVKEGAFNSGQKLDIDWGGLASGDYRISCAIEKGAGEHRDFTLFSYNDKDTPDKTNCFFFPLNKECLQNGNIEFLYGGKAKQLYASLEIYAKNDTILYKENFVAKKGMKKYSFPYLSTYPDDVKILLTTIYEGAVFNKHASYKRKFEKDTLSMKFISLRDKSKPKAKESFSIEVKNTKGVGQKANIILTASDVANDLPFEHKFLPLNTNIAKWSEIWVRPSIGLEKNDVNFKFGTLPANYEELYSMEETGDYERTWGGRQGKKEDDIYTRRNFRATAAFIRNVVTDENGRVDIEFSYPDNYATYKIMAVAITKDANSVIQTDEVLITNEVMVSAMLPQFLRSGDRVLIKAKASNTTDFPLEAVLKIKSSEKIISNSTSFKLSLPARSSEIVEFEIQVSENADALDLRLELDADKHKDIEITNTPIIEAVERYYKTQVLTLKEKVKYVNLSDFIPSEKRENEKLHVLFSAPEPLLIRKLPYMLQPESESLITTLDNWYLLGVGVRMTYPYRSILKGWLEAIPEDTVNLRISDFLESETPWKFQTDYARLKTLIQWTEPEYHRKHTWNYILKFTEYQNNDGGYPWFKGMPSSPYVTMSLLDKHTKLIESEYYADYEKITHRRYLGAVNYIDEYMKNRWNRKEIGKYLSSEDLNYLRVRAGYLTKVEPNTDAKQTIENYVKRAKNEWKHYSLMDKTCLALALNAMGEDVSALVASIKEFAVVDNVGELYFPNAVMPFRGMINSEIYAHTMILTLLRSLPTRDYGFENDLAQWMMQQQRNQLWSNKTIATEATWTLYLHYQDLRARNKLLSGRGGIQMPPGYPLYRNSFSGNSVNVDKVREEKKPIAFRISTGQNDSIPAFADLAYSCDMPLKEIPKQATGFDVERKLYRVYADREELVTSETVLHLGDEVVVRYYIKNNHNRNFVHVRSLRTGALRPLDNVSRYNGRGYYREVKANESNFFFYIMPEGDNFIEERFVVEHAGLFNDGFMRVESLLAPFYQGNTTTNTLKVD